ncbi:MAG: tetratricopeptide repeat protein [Spirochaetaceae bacterium]|jgi:tetratricopeptide (TPR) repeat protein|nr:tetratricopeptide repeat protein [Spirochaetaceae bacterium]
MKFRSRVIVFLSLFCVISAYNALSQAWLPPDENAALMYTGIDRGIELYGEGLWGEAIAHLRGVQRQNISAEARAEAQFWIAISAFAAGQYEEAVHYFDEIARIDPGNIRCAEVPYHKGRAYYYLKRYNDAIRLLGVYVDSIRIDGRYLGGIRINEWNDKGVYGGADSDYTKKAAAIYWMGECFYALGDMSRSEELFNSIVNNYPKSHKFEPASNRLSLIKQKKIETELLNILKSVPAESGSVRAEASPAQKQATEEAILAYQKRIAPYLITGAYNERPKVPAVEAVPPPDDKKMNQKDIDDVMRLLAIKTRSLEMMDRLVSTLNTYEIIEEEEW